MTKTEINIPSDKQLYASPAAWNGLPEDMGAIADSEGQAVDDLLLH